MNIEPFPDPRHAPADAPLAMGGDLSAERLALAYASGIFPWFDADAPILWWSPDPRAVIELDGLHVSRRLGRRWRQGRFTVSIDRAFGSVIRACSRPKQPLERWITPAMVMAYEELHRIGMAHSIEIWNGTQLTGGLYGVALGGLFAAESMFHRQRDASKLALVALVDRMTERGFTLLDVQLLNPHLASMGAREIPRTTYLERLQAACLLPATFA